MCLSVPRELRQHRLELLTCDSLGFTSPVRAATVLGDGCGQALTLHHVKPGKSSL